MHERTCQNTVFGEAHGPQPEEPAPERPAIPQVIEYTFYIDEAHDPYEELGVVD